MRIVVLVKPVPDPASAGERLGPDDRLDRAAAPAVVNGNDEYVLEAALKLVEAAGEGEITLGRFWMRRQAASVRGELQAAVDRALDNGSVTALVVLAFVAVIREGVETALFLTGQAAATSDDTGALSVLLGAIVGLAIAALIGIGFYKGSRRINLATFFRWTGVALVFIAAGLLSHAVHEFIEIGLINVGTQTLFDISAILPHEGDGSATGQMLRALFGYTSTPEVATFAVWLTYVVVVLALFLRPVKRPPAPARATEPVATTPG